MSPSSERMDGQCVCLRHVECGIFCQGLVMKVGGGVFGSQVFYFVFQSWCSRLAVLSCDVAAIHVSY